MWFFLITENLNKYCLYSFLLHHVYRISAVQYLNACWFKNRLIIFSLLSGFHPLVLALPTDLSSRDTTFLNSNIKNMVSFIPLLFVLSGKGLPYAAICRTLGFFPPSFQINPPTRWESEWDLNGVKGEQSVACRAEFLRREVTLKLSTFLSHCRAQVLHARCFAGLYQG
jgi:hypothetical protein